MAQNTLAKPKMVSLMVFYTWSNGDKYVGNWKDNKLHGQGTYTSVKGNKYVGEFNNDKRTGYGTYIFKWR